METKMNTQHAIQRSQQRGIPPLIQDWLLFYGKETYNGKGTIVRYFTSDSIRKMERDFGREPIRRLSEFLKCYLVESVDGFVITVGKRYKRINH
jgi:hypothetical protein